MNQNQQQNKRPAGSGSSDDRKPTRQKTGDNAVGGLSFDGRGSLIKQGSRGVLDGVPPMQFPGPASGSQAPGGAPGGLLNMPLTQPVLPKNSPPQVGTSPGLVGNAPKGGKGGASGSRGGSPPPLGMNTVLGSPNPNPQGGMNSMSRSSDSKGGNDKGDNKGDKGGEKGSGFRHRGDNSEQRGRDRWNNDYDREHRSSRDSASWGRRDSGKDHGGGKGERRNSREYPPPREKGRKSDDKGRDGKGGRTKFCSKITSGI